MNSGKGKRLSPAIWNQIRKRHLEGEKAKDLATEYDVAPETISRRATKHNWKRPEQLKVEAIKEVEEEIKEDYKALARKANHEQFQVYRSARNVGVNLLKELSEGRLPGQSVYQYRIIMEGLRISHDGIRESLRIDDLNCPFVGDEEQDMGAVERLTQLLTPISREEAAKMFPDFNFNDEEPDNQSEESTAIN
ncbi:hypothetical protein SBDP1_340012 [Syntrophobacter sp. SbD1]|nr:hypothetical protein SBDP1_340012 [Syntrophobacter sp. SbD1]